MPLPRRAFATAALAALTAGLAAPALAARAPAAPVGKGGCPPGMDPRLLCQQILPPRPGPASEDWRPRHDDREGKWHPRRHHWRAPNGNPGPFPPVLRPY